MHFVFLFSVCCIVFNCSWPLIMFDKKQKSCISCIYDIFNDGLYDPKSFLQSRNWFYSSSINDDEFINYKHIVCFFFRNLSQHQGSKEEQKKFDTTTEVYYLQRFKSFNRFDLPKVTCYVIFSTKKNCCRSCRNS